MRALALLLLLLLAPSSSATPPRTDFFVHLHAEGAPAPGEPFRIVATAFGDIGGDATLRLAVPEGVEVRGDPWWDLRVGAGESKTRAWEVVARSEGLWNARLLEVQGERDAWTRACCVWARTSAEGAVAATRPYDVVMPARFDDALHAKPLNATHVRVRHVVELQEAWRDQARLELRFERGDGLDASPAWGEAAQPVEAVAVVALAEGGEARVMLDAQLALFFRHEPGPLEDFAAESVPLSCKVAVLARSGGEVRWAATEPCDAHAVPADAEQPGARGVPAPGAGAALVALALSRSRSRRCARARA